MYVVSKPSDKINEIEGSPYFEEQYTPGILFDEKGKTEHAYFRYNVAKDQVEIKIAPTQEQTFILPRYQRYSYQLKNYSYILDKLSSDEGKMLEGYFMEYFKGTHSRLLAKPTIKLIPGKEAKTGYDKARPAHLEINQIYYLQLEDGPLHEVRLKEKDFKKYLEDKQGMKSYFSTHKIRDMEDVKKMLEFYDTSVE